MQQIDRCGIQQVVAVQARKHLQLRLSIEFSIAEDELASLPDKVAFVSLEYGGIDELEDQ